MTFTPAIYFFDSAAVLGEKVGYQFNDRIYFCFFERFCNKHDFVLVHEITSSFGHMTLPAEGLGA